MSLFVGAWKLCSFEYQALDGTVFHPYGHEPIGRIFYDKGGEMAALISRSDRVPLSCDDFIMLPDSEKVALARGFIAYSGKYKVFNDKIIHYTEVSFIPNWIGTEMVRFYTLDGDNLTLKTPPVILRNKEFIGVIQWQRI